ncbi:MAG: 16S rRNA methyltransferase [Candidatus Methanofastidiosia archaeon]|jgi:rRNA small subunit pseudouridine methyltransferase Nep1
MLTLVIAEAALEVVPKSLVTHPVIVKSAKKRGKPPQKILLDSNYHHSAMKTLKDAQKRGRPDIVHVSLLCALESVVNKRGDLNVYVHTYNDDIIYINPETRIPRSYNRFCGLMEKLFETGSIKRLLSVQKKSLNNFLEELPGGIVIMEKGGQVIPLKKDMICVVGGFPHGTFTNELPYDKMGISNFQLTAWSVINELVVRYEFL